MTSNVDLHKTDPLEFTDENIHASELISNILLLLKKEKNFNDSFILSKPCNFNFQTASNGDHISDYGTILSFLNTPEGIFAILNNNFEEKTDILLNMLIDKTHLNIMGSIEKIYQSNTGSAYVAEIHFKNLSSNDKNSILQLINIKKETATLIEKREHARLQKHIPVTYQVYKDKDVLNERAAIVYTIDISRGGVKIASPEKLHMNNLLYMQIPFKNKTIFCAGKVIWTNYSDQTDKHLAGIKFDGMSADMKENLIELLMS